MLIAQLRPRSPTNTFEGQAPTGLSSSVFVDESGRRQRRARRLGQLLAACLAGYLVLVGASLAPGQWLPRLSLPVVSGRLAPPAPPPSTIAGDQAAPPTPSAPARAARRQAKPPAAKEVVAPVRAASEPLAPAGISSTTTTTTPTPSTLSAAPPTTAPTSTTTTAPRHNPPAATQPSSTTTTSTTAPRPSQGQGVGKTGTPPGLARKGSGATAG